MTSQGSERDPVERLAEEFAERHRRGERPTLTEYAEKHPELADQIRELFPALLVMEQFGSVGGASPGPVSSPLPADGSEWVQLGEYRILREIGRGGMGVVYEAVQESLSRHVALKVLPFHGAANPTYRERFRREAQAAAKLHHTNIVPVFGVGEFKGVHYYAMQFIRGQGLDAVLREIQILRKPQSAGERTDDPDATRSLALKLLTGSFPVPDTVAGEEERKASPAEALQFSPLAADATSTDSPSVAPSSASELAGQTEYQYYYGVARLGLQIAEALAYAHQHGVLHRDIKPSNLLLDGDGIVWITDFGLAKAEGSGELTHSGDIIGTIRYMAPERFEGVSDARCDVYGLGVTLYELVTLRPAFADTDRVKLVQRVTNDHPLRPRVVDPRIPSDLETIVLKAMARESGDRYPTAGAMAEDLLRFLEDRPIRARRASWSERAWRWCRRNPALATVGALAAACLLAIASLSAVLAYEQGRLAEGERRKIQQQVTAANKLKEEHEETLTALNISQRLTADLEVDQSLGVCEKGDVGLGMLRLADCLERAVNAKAPDLEQAVRANLGAWRREWSPLQAVVGNDSPVSAVAFSPKGDLFLTAARHGVVQRWNAVRGDPVGRPLKSPLEIRAAAWSRDGAAIAIGGGNPQKVGEVWVYSVKEEPTRRVGLLHCPAEVRAVAFSPDGKTLLAGSVDGTARRWNLNTGEEIEPALRHAKQVLSVAYSPDGRTILTGSMDTTARLWDAATGALTGTLAGHEGEVWTAVYSPRGDVIATGGLDRTARLWDAKTRQPIGDGPLPQHTPVVTAAFSPDGTILATGGGSGLLLFWKVDRARGGKPTGRPLKHPAGVESAAFAPDGKTILTGCKDGVGRLWQVSFAPPADFPLDYPNKAMAAAISSNGQVVVTGNEDGSAPQWEAATGRRLSDGLPRQNGELDALAFDWDGDLLFTGAANGSAQLLRVPGGAPVGKPLVHAGGVWAAAFNPDGKLVLYSDTNGKVYRWERETDKAPEQLLEFPWVVQTLLFDPAGRLLLTGAPDGGAQLRSVADPQSRPRPLHTQGGCWSAAFSHDGKTCVTGSGDGAAQRWTTDTGKVLGAAIGCQGRVHAVAFGPDDQTILTGDASGAARLWQAATGKPLGPAVQFAHEILAVGFSHDEQGIMLRMTDGRQVSSRPTPVPVPGDVERIRFWIQMITGVELAEDRSVHVLDPAAWRENRRRLEELGGLPVP